jgi:hypothetical protein
MHAIIETQLRHLVHLLGDRKGVSTMEYGVMAAGVVTLVALGAVALGSAISSYLETAVAANL